MNINITKKPLRILQYMLERTKHDIQMLFLLLKTDINRSIFVVGILCY